MGDFVPRKHLSKSDQEESQMSAYDRHVDLGFTIFEAFGGEAPDQPVLALGSI